MGVVTMEADELQHYCREGEGEEAKANVLTLFRHLESSLVTLREDGQLGSASLFGRRRRFVNPGARCQRRGHQEG